MKYSISWFERSQGSPMEYENAQQRILERLTQWKSPDGFDIKMSVVRVGEWDAHMLVACTDPQEVHKLCSTYPSIKCEAKQSHREMA